MDPITAAATAFATAQAAVAGIQKAIKLGKDINQLELWEMMLKERMKIKQAREKSEREAKIARRKLVAQRILVAQIVGGGIVVIILGVLIIFIVRQALA